MKYLKTTLLHKYLTNNQYKKQRLFFIIMAIITNIDKFGIRNSIHCL